MLIFCRKTSNLSKALCSPVIYYEFFVMKPLLSSSYLLNKTSILSKLYTKLWAIKVNTMPFFSDFSRKSQRSHAHILYQKLPFSKKHSVLMQFFWNFSWSPAVEPIFGHKNANSVITKLQYGLKMSTRCSFQEFFTKE